MLAMSRPCIQNLKKSSVKGKHFRYPDQTQPKLGPISMYGGLRRDVRASPNQELESVQVAVLSCEVNRHHALHPLQDKYENVGNYVHARWVRS